MVRIYLQVKCEVFKKTSQGVSDERHQTVIVFRRCMLCGQSLSGNVWGPWARSPTPLP